MGLFDLVKKEEIENIAVKTPKDLFIDGLKSASGSAYSRKIDYNIFYKIVAFQGVKDGVGCSTIVANTAFALAKLGITVCVVDTSILSPCQNVLLNTDYKKDRDKTDGAVDWFDIFNSTRNVVTVSKYDSKIGVLAFNDRTIIDLLSSSDNSDMVECALTQLNTKYDIILVDVCHEQTAIATSCMQQAHKVIQVWSDSIHLLDNSRHNLKNNMILSVPLDKMLDVITSMTVDDIPTNWDEVLKPYKLRRVAHVGMSKDIARLNARGKMIFDYASSSEDVQEFNDCIADIVCILLNISNDNRTYGKLTVEQITNGEVEGTVSKKFSDRERAINDAIAESNAMNANLGSLDNLGKTEGDSTEVNSYRAETAESEILEEEVVEEEVLDDDFDFFTQTKRLQFKRR